MPNARGWKRWWRSCAAGIRPGTRWCCTRRRSCRSMRRGWSGCRWPTCRARTTRNTPPWSFRRCGPRAGCCCRLPEAGAMPPWTRAHGVRSLRLDHRLARHALLARGRVPGKGGHDRRGLLQVLRLGVVPGVQVRVVHVGEVVETVLDELEAGQAHPVEGDVVGAAGVAGGHRGGADIVEGLQPRL